MPNKIIKIRNRKTEQTKKQASKQKDVPLSISRKFLLNRINIDIELTQSVYLRTGQTITSFSSSSQQYYINLNTLIASSNNFAKFLTSGVPNFEFIKCSGFSLAFYPSSINSVSTTFEPAAFDLRYLPAYSTNTVLPTGYQGNFNESHYNVLLQQTTKPFYKRFSLKELPSYVVSENNRQCLGQMINGYNYANYPGDHGGILSIIQSTPSVNTIATYNPKLGFIEIKFHIEFYNSIV
jgi:hypothetical protein